MATTLDKEQTLNPGGTLKAMMVGGALPFFPMSDLLWGQDLKGAIKVK